MLFCFCYLQLVRKQTYDRLEMNSSQQIVRSFVIVEISVLKTTSFEWIISYQKNSWNYPPTTGNVLLLIHVFKNFVHCPFRLLNCKTDFTTKTFFLNWFVFVFAFFLETELILHGSWLCQEFLTHCKHANLKQIKH